ncbi:protein LURP-one-related 11 [Ricinus communis]|uniref:GTP binding protein, putative n=1 Tax=Ricinus communis TaxID=3988 RepID=B9RC90_RICCO|nr:protein LURP-one-related 11 [Ricinus communis]EEF51161.1 GTP binding protein, putative [Ricinus communis]|eukprot:XP_002509774.1 protein LURP-one-related 11 [Ricinus communis]
MAKVHPFLLLASDEEDSACSSSSTTSCMTASKTESYTIWMKSLVMQANGCTVYNDNGEIVYRVDNYDKKGSSEVYLMDLKGRVLFTIRKQLLFRQWKGYKSDELKSRKQKPFFQVRQSSRILKRNLSCKIAVRSGTWQDGYYKLKASAGKSAFKITDSNGGLVAKATRKQTSTGIVLGDDVLTLAVEPHVDHSFIMALVTVYGLMIHRL